ncbi:MAG: polymerase [Treponema sp.]|jgi:hypothetical protein|nr:polymerase [Treponema sp.]
MKRIAIFICLLFTGFLLQAQAKIGINGEIDWEKFEFNARLSLDLFSAKVRLPAGRIQAEEILREEYPRRVRPYLLALPVDSANTLGDWISKRYYNIQKLDALSLSAREVPPNLSPDLTTMNGSYIVSLFGLSSDLMEHSRAEELPRILNPVSAASYTGIIILADEPLPVHGRNSSALTLPCVLPRVWDANMNLIYELNTIDPRRNLRPYERSQDEPSALPRINMDEKLPRDRFLKNVVVRYVNPDKIFASSPSGMDEELERLVGPNPLRILAREVYGLRPTDPVIDVEDAYTILANENNRRLLREGRVAIVLNKNVLKSTGQ